MLAGRTYTPQDFVQLFVQWYWVIVIPWVLFSIAAVIYSRTLPDQFRSESVIQVVPQRVPENLVRSTVTAKIEERLPAISQQILSRTRLERIIQDFGLYTERRKTQLMEDVVAAMSSDVKVEIVKGDAFRVSYISTDAKTAMKVTERLASLFVEENLRDREVLAEGANQFLGSQLDDARRRLVEHDKKLEEFRRRYNGELPSQMQANIQAIQNAENQIQALSESMLRDRDRRLVLERMLADSQIETTLARPVAPASAAARTGDADASMPADAPAAVQVEAAKTALQGMRLRLKPEHPDVVRMERAIRELEKKAAAEAARAPAAAGDSAESRPVVSPAEVMRQNRMREIRTEMDSLDREISRKTAAQAKLKVVVSDLQARVDRTPTRESDLTSLMRDYETLDKVYTTLLAKGEEAKVAANMERRQIGEQFKVIDAARMPEQPFSPNRLQIGAIGSAAGLILGLAIIALIEIKDASFRSDQEVVSFLSLPVIATVPAIITAEERLVARRLRLRLAGAGTVALLAILGAGVVWRAGFLDRWL
jgi:polysaccharide chain length determinant protein (PEP-CTERM system associated)